MAFKGCSKRLLNFLILPLKPAALISYSIFGSWEGSHIPSSATIKLIGVSSKIKNKNLFIESP